MKDFDYYQARDLSYPVKPKQVTMKSATPTEDQISIYLQDKATYDKELQDYTKEKAEYDSKYAARILEFWEDAKHELCCHSYSTKVWEACCAKAWEDGHSGGFSEVYHYLTEATDFVDIILEKA